VELFLAFIHPTKGLVVVTQQLRILAHRAPVEIRRDSKIVVSSRDPSFTAA
jgi:hypothetical protein